MLKFLTDKKNEKYREKLTIFFICLAISTFVWMLIKLSDQYSTIVTIPVTYNNIPEGKILINNVDTTIKIGLSDRGFSLVWLKYFSHKQPLHIDLKDYKLHQKMHQYAALVGTHSWSQKFLEQYAMHGKVDYILPDTIEFYFENRYSKQVPVKPNFDFKFKKQFFAYDSLILTPDKVEISGLYQSISKIEFVETRQKTFDNLSTSVNQNIALRKPIDSPDFKASPEAVNLKMIVEKFTESQIEVPVSIINQPHNMRIKIFPDNLTIKYLVALKDFKKINADMFVCSVDLSKINGGNNNKLEVSLNTFPAFIKIVNIDPAEVDFLVLK